MSEYWGLHCKTCDSETGHGLNHGDYDLSLLANHRYAVKEIATLGCLIRVEVSGFNEVVPWLCEHADHDIELSNEYRERKPLMNEGD